MRRDLHILIVPVDLSNAEDVDLVVEHLVNFVQRSIPIRFGIVPIINSPEAAEQAKILYHLYETYNLSGVLEYLRLVSVIIFCYEWLSRS